MIRHVVAVLALGSLVGCQAMMGPDARADDPDRAQLAAFAATAQYPDVEPSEELDAAALIDRRQDTIEVLNFGNQPIRNARVWINGSYVTEAAHIPPNGSLALRRGDFYDQTGRALADVATTITRVELQVEEDQLYRLSGPAFRQR